jgi:hypothetical protein
MDPLLLLKIVKWDPSGIPILPRATLAAIGNRESIQPLRNNVATKLRFPRFAKHEIRRNYFPISRNFAKFCEISRNGFWQNFAKFRQISYYVSRWKKLDNIVPFSVHWNGFRQNFYKIFTIKKLDNILPFIATSSCLLRIGLKGQCHEIFVSAFFIKQLLLVLIGMPRKYFSFFKNILELFVFVFPVKYTRESLRIPKIWNFSNINHMYLAS